MLELEEAIKQLQELTEKIKNLGESLWHTTFRKKIRRIRKRNK